MYATETKEIRLLVTKGGTLPFKTWLESLKNQKAVERIEVRMARMRTGNLGDCKSVGKGVYELRIDYGPGYRIYFGQAGAKIVLLTGGVKNTQHSDIKKAQNLWTREE